MTLGSVSGDGRDALMVMRNVAGGMQIYDLYLQNPDNLFSLQPALTYTNQADWRTTLCWADINRDGKLDLIKSTFVNEPFFVPGMRSGKVFVRIFLPTNTGVFRRSRDRFSARMTGLPRCRWWTWMGMAWWISCWATYPLKHARTCTTYSPLEQTRVAV